MTGRLLSPPLQHVRTNAFKQCCQFVQPFVYSNSVTPDIQSDTFYVHTSHGAVERHFLIRHK